MEKIWLDSYGEGVLSEINADAYPSLVDVLEQAFAEHASRAAFINMDAQITYAELDKKSLDFAAYLQNLGLEKGTPIAVMMPNLLQYPIAIIGILRAGMTVVNVNPMYTARELKHQLNDSKAKAIIIIENFAKTLQEVCDETQVEHIFTTQIGDMMPLPKRWLVNFAVKRIKKMVPEFSLPSSSSFSSAIKQGVNYNYVRPEITGDCIAFLQYTGGTTGVSKGAMLTHRNMVGNLQQIYAFLEPVVEKHKELIVTALPLYHIFALMANCFTFLKYGCSNLLITNPRDMPGFVEELKKVDFTIMTGVNTLFNGLMNTPGFKELDFSKLKFGLGGGMAVQRPVAERWQSMTGSILLEGYGLTECSPVVTITPGHVEGFTGTIGLPVPSTEVKLMDEDGNEVAIGEPGEMWVKGPQVMKGYLNRPEATDEVLKDGWFATGDIATVDEKGYFSIVDRKKDMIIVSGFNVFPNEIEEVAVGCEGVSEAAAIGEPHEVTGEIVKLFVVRTDQNLTEQDVINHCRAHLTGYKVPKIIVFRDELPKTNVGKILRRELR